MLDDAGMDAVHFVNGDLLVDEELSSITSLIFSPLLLKFSPSELFIWYY